GVVISAGRADTPMKPDAKEIERLVGQLVEGKSKEREEARRGLGAGGGAGRAAPGESGGGPKGRPHRPVGAALVARSIFEKLFCEVRRFEGHTGAVRYLAISPDGKRVLSASGWPQGDNTLRYWDLATGKEIHTLRGHSSMIETVAISPDGKW